jgi:hypothetical protein
MRCDVDQRSRKWKKRMMSPRIRCTCNGVDITRRCQVADTREGWARCLRLNDAGHPFVDPKTQGVAKEELRGSVRVWWERP